MLSPHHVAGSNLCAHRAHLTNSGKSERNLTSLVWQSRCPVIILLGISSLLIACGGSTGTSNGGTSSPPPPTIPKVYTAWGDSLTAGCEDGTQPSCAYPYELAQLGSYKTVNNQGIGGQTSTQIAVRMGAVPTSVTNTFTIPASGSVSGVTFESGHEPCFNVGSPGLVEGTIDNVQVYCQSMGAGNYTLTRVAAGSQQIVNSGDPWTPVLSDGVLSGMNIIWAGRNDTSLCPTSNVTVDNCPAAGNIAAMTSYITAHKGQYLVLTVLHGVREGAEPSSAYEWTKAINTWILATFPSNSLEINTPVIAAYNPNNGADVLDHEQGFPPFSLRAFDYNGNLAAAITDPGTCAISFGKTVPRLYIVTVASEYILITAGTDGAYTCTRGYGGTTAAIHASASPWTAADPLHLSGDGSANKNNPNGTGYTVVAKAVQQWLAEHQQ
jgi:lysophospholipase L1-like esterase